MRFWKNAWVIFGACLVLGSDQEIAIETIVVGSCAQQTKAQPFWQPMLAENPHLFLFIGDNIYANNMKYRRLRKEYKKLGRQQGFRAMKRQATIMATWDDHDYGLNDGGVEYCHKKDSKRAFLNFFKPPKTTRVWGGEGIYHQRIFGEADRRVQVIMLDTRYFRSYLNALPKKEWGKHGRYLTDTNPDKTILGEAQWEWLEQTLKQPAAVRFIVTSIQAIPNDHQWEKWGNFPHERKRLLKLIQSTGARGVVLISGDRHAGEISLLPEGDPQGVGYPLYEITASGLNTKIVSSPEEVNSYRVGERQIENHYAVIHIHWQAEPMVTFQLKPVDGSTPKAMVEVPLRDLN